MAYDFGQSFELKVDYNSVRHFTEQWRCTEETKNVSQFSQDEKSKCWFVEAVFEDYSFLTIRLRLFSAGEKLASTFTLTLDWAGGTQRTALEGCGWFADRERFSSSVQWPRIKVINSWTLCFLVKFYKILVAIKVYFLIGLYIIIINIIYKFLKLNLNYIYNIMRVNSNTLKLKGINEVQRDIKTYSYLYN